MPPARAVHDSFTLTRVYRHPPARVFAAFATEEGKRRWFSSPRADWEWELLDRHFDFRVGGTEVLEARFPGGKHSRFDATFHDIVPDRRIVYAYRMQLGGVPISVSLATIELAAEGSGTRLTVTEQGVFLDGYEDAGSREHGTGMLLDWVGASLD